MHLFKCILCFKDIEKDYERCLVQSKKKTTTSRSQIWSSMCTLHQSTLVGSIMVSSRREIICSRTWKNYQNQWESSTQQRWRKSWPCFPAEIRVKWGSRPTGLLRFVAFFICRFFSSSRPFVASPLFMKGTMLCYKEKLEPSVVPWQIFKRSQVCTISVVHICMRFVEFDTSVLCHVLVYCFGSFLSQDIFLSL